MASTKFIERFPLFLPKGKNGSSVSGTNWQRARSPVECINAKISDAPLDASTISSIDREMIHASEHIQYRITGNHGSSTSVKKYKFWQFVKKFKCVYPDRVRA